VTTKRWARWAENDRPTEPTDDASDVEPNGRRNGPSGDVGTSEQDGAEPIGGSGHVPFVETVEAAESHAPASPGAAADQRAAEGRG
jgi:hypothetical protein